MTCDDTHVWLAPFTPGGRHVVTITFDSAFTLGMLRIWNYNKNRIHSLRGARWVGDADCWALAASICMLATLLPGSQPCHNMGLDKLAPKLLRLRPLAA
jgi:hypothetical protein